MGAQTRVDEFSYGGGGTWARSRGVGKPRAGLLVAVFAMLSTLAAVFLFAGSVATAQVLDDPQRTLSDGSQGALRDDSGGGGSGSTAPAPSPDRGSADRGSAPPARQDPGLASGGADSRRSGAAPADGPARLLPGSSTAGPAREISTPTADRSTLRRRGNLDTGQALVPERGRAARRAGPVAPTLQTGDHAAARGPRNLDGAARPTHRGLRPAAGQVDETAGTVSGPLAGPTRRTFEPARRTVEGPARTVAEPDLGTAEQLVGTAPQATRPAATGPLDEAAGPVRQAVGRVAEPVDQVVEPARKTLGRAEHSAFRTAEPLTGTVREAAEPAGRAVEENIEPVTRSVSRTVEQVNEPVRRTADPVVEPARETLEPTLRPLREKLAQVVGAAEEAVDGAVGPAQDAADALAGGPVGTAQALLDPSGQAVASVMYGSELGLAGTPGGSRLPAPGLTASPSTPLSAGAGEAEQPPAATSPSIEPRFAAPLQRIATVAEEAVLSANGPAYLEAERVARVADSALPTAGTFAGSSGGALKGPLGLFVERTMPETRALGSIWSPASALAFDRPLSGAGPGGSHASHVAGGSPGQAPPVSKAPPPFSGTTTGSAGGLGSGSGSGAGLLGALALTLALSPFCRRMLRYSREVLAPTSALTLAIERPG